MFSLRKVLPILTLFNTSGKCKTHNPPFQGIRSRMLLLVYRPLFLFKREFVLKINWKFRFRFQYIYTSLIYSKYYQTGHCLG